MSEGELSTCNVKVAIVFFHFLRSRRYHQKKRGETVESNSAYGTQKLISLVILLVASLQQTAWHCSSLFFFSYRRKLSCTYIKRH